MPAHAVDQVEARIAELVEARRPQLEQLVRAQVDRLLGELLEAELNGRTNGARQNLTRSENDRANWRDHDSQDVTGATARTCRHCGQSKPLDQFGQHRHVCRGCRADQQARARERRAQPAEQGDAPRPGTAST